MYRIIGSDGKEYGPVSAQQLREWIGQGRVNAQTQVLLEGTTEWKPLSGFPEFMTGSQPSASAAPIPPAASTMLSGATAVSGPATGLIVTAIVGFVAQLASLAAHFAGVGMGMMQGGHHGGSPFPPELAMMMSGTFAVVSGIVGVAVSGVILYGGLKMKKLESYPLAIAASILAAVPCLSPCCLIGLPIGIWALIVLFKPEVKDAFNQNS
jgi:hypothetical protein